MRTEQRTASPRGERGSALLTGIALSLSASLVALFVLAKLERTNNLSFFIGKARSETLLEANKKATVLNEMVMNNALIIRSIFNALDAWHDLFVARERLAATAPFWVSSEKREQEESEVLRALMQATLIKAKRGFVIAEGLSRKSEELSKLIDSHFPMRRSTTKETFCFAFSLYVKSQAVAPFEGENCMAQLNEWNWLDFEKVFSPIGQSVPDLALYLPTRHNVTPWPPSKRNFNTLHSASQVRAELFRFLASLFEMPQEQRFSSGFSATLKHPLQNNSLLGIALTPHWVGVVLEQTQEVKHGDR